MSDIAGGIMWPVEGSVQPTILRPYLPEDAHITMMVFDEPLDGFARQDIEDILVETVPSLMLLVGARQVEYFGPKNDVPVLRVEHELLTYYRAEMEKALRKAGIEWNTKFEYKPHITLAQPPEENEFTFAGKQILTGPLEMWWM